MWTFYREKWAYSGGPALNKLFLGWTTSYMGPKLIFYGPLYSGPFSEGRFRGGGGMPPPPPLTTPLLNIFLFFSNVRYVKYFLV